MAIARVSEATVLVTGSNLGSYTATSDFTVTGGSSNILVVAVMMQQDAATPADDVVVTAEGVTMSVGGQQTNGNAGEPYGGIYYLVSPSAGATTIVADPQTVIGRGCIIWCGEYSGVDIADPIGATVVDQDADSTPPGITPEAVGNFVISMMAVRGGSIPFEPDSDVTELVDTESGTNTTGDIAGFVGEYVTVGTSQVDVFATPDPAAPTVSIAVELRASSTTITSSGGSTITAVTSSGTAERTVTSSGASTITAVTSAGTAEREVVSSGASTIIAITNSGEGTTGAGVEAEGASSITPVTSSGTAVREITSSGASTIGSVQTSGTIYSRIGRRVTQGRMGLGLHLGLSREYGRLITPQVVGIGEMIIEDTFEVG